MRFSSFRMLAIAWIAIAVPAFALPGCSWFDGSNKNAPLIAAPRSPISDVPIPTGFKMTDDSTSTVTPATSIRVVDHRYKGSEDLLPIVKFYRDQMPEKGWTWVEQNQARGGEITLHFTKNSEECVITVSPGRGFDNYIRVKIDRKK